MMQPSVFDQLVDFTLGTDSPDPEPPDIGVVTASLNQIIDALADGYERVGPATSGLMWGLITIDVVYFGIMVALGLDQVQNGFRKLLVISLWLWFIQEFEKNANALVNTLVSLGMMVGGQPGGNWRMVLDPSRILSKGFELTHVLVTNMPDSLGITDYIGAVIAFLLLHVAFWAIAANAYILVVGFYLTLCVAGALLPLVFFKYTKSYAMRGLTAVVSHGVHLMLVAIATALVETVVRRLKFSETPTMHETWSMVFVIGTLAVLAWKGPQRYASSFMSGAVGMDGTDGSAMLAQTGGATATVVSAIFQKLDKGMKKVDPYDKPQGKTWSRAHNPSQSIHPVEARSGGSGSGVAAAPPKGERAGAPQAKHSTSAAPTTAEAAARANEPQLVASSEK